MWNQMNTNIEQESDRRGDAGGTQAVPRFVADALAWMEIQRVGLARLRQYQLEEGIGTRADVTGRRLP